ncbi:MAG: suppressor of fused domain protein [Propionibacteriaceae bacterium]
MTTPPDDDRLTPGGDPFFDHRDDQAATSGDPVAPRDEVRRRACEAHLTEFLGDDFHLLSEKVSVGIHLDVYVFPPSEQSPHVTLITSGMSDLAMNVPEGFTGNRLELMIALPPGWPGIDPLDWDQFSAESNYWPLRMLKDVARIPSTYDSYITWGHSIVDEDQSLFAPGVQFAGAIVGPPLGYPPRIMRAVTPVGEVDYLAVFPTTQAEMDFKVATPGGGDALIDRFTESNVTAVIDPTRSSVVSGPPAWSVRLLMANRADHLGEVLDEALPNRAARLAEERAEESVVPTADGQEVRFRVSGPLNPEQLITDAAHSPLADRVNGPVREHGGVLTLTPVGPGIGDEFMAVIAMAVMIAERSDVLALWFPQQQYVTTAEQFRTDAMDDALLTFRVHPTEFPDGGTAVITRGLAALGGREVLLRDDEMDHDDLVKRVTSALGKLDGAASSAPAADQQVRYGFSKYVLREGVHPGTGEPVLEMVPPEKKKRGLFGRR